LESKIKKLDQPTGFAARRKGLKFYTNLLTNLQMAENCIFCDIATGHAPASPVYEDDLVIAFNDLYPKAPVHILVVPKVHIATAAEMQDSQEELFGHLTWVANKIAAEKKLPGYKLIMNVGKEGGQVIFHVHLHLLGGWSGAAPEV
jgi:histidine triad (HIT) family protein